MKLYEALPDGTNGREVGQTFFASGVLTWVWERSTPWVKGPHVQTRKIIYTPAKDERQAMNELMAYDLMAVQE